MEALDCVNLEDAKLTPLIPLLKHLWYPQTVCLAVRGISLCTTATLQGACPHAHACINLVMHEKVVTAGGSVCLLRVGSESDSVYEHEDGISSIMLCCNMCERIYLISARTI